MELTVAQLAQRIGAELVGDGSGKILAVGTVETAGANEVTFISSDKYILKLADSRAGAVIVVKRIEDLNKPQLVVKNANMALLEALNIFAPRLRAPKTGVDPTAKVGQDVKIAPGVAIGAAVVIADKVQIGENTVISDGCKIGENSKIGKNCRLDGNVVIYHNCTIGNNVIIQANSTIGSTGFGYFFFEGSHRLIPHNGGVIIEDFVEIGANCCVDRAKFGNTIIGAGTKIDNLVQIAHNVVIGKCCLIAGMVGIAGSAKLGDGVVLAGQVAVIDNVEIGNGTIVAASSLVTHNVPAGQQVFGTPATDKDEAFKIIALTNRLPKLVERVKQLEKQLESLKKNQPKQC